MASSFFHNLFKRSAEKIMPGMRDAADGLLQNPELQEFAVEAISTEVANSVDEVFNDTKGFLENAAEGLDPDKKGAWDTIRESIAPNGGIGNLLFAGLVWAGAQVSAFAAALFVDKKTGREEKDTNWPIIARIISSLVGKAAGLRNQTA